MAVRKSQTAFRKTHVLLQRSQFDAPVGQRAPAGGRQMRQTKPIRCVLGRGSGFPTSHFKLGTSGSDYDKQSQIAVAGMSNNAIRRHYKRENKANSAGLLAAVGGRNRQTRNPNTETRNKSENPMTETNETCQTKPIGLDGPARSVPVRAYQITPYGATANARNKANSAGPFPGEAGTIAGRVSKQGVFRR